MPSAKMDSSNSPPHTHKKTQACDACRLRKVKCNGAARCQQCSHLNLRCIYSAPRARARSTTKRGTLISRYKAESQTSPTSTIPSPLSDHSHSADAHLDFSGSESAPYNSPRAMRLPSLVDVIPVGAPPTSAQVEEMMPLNNDPDYFLSFMPDYEKCVYPVNPIVTPEEVRQAIHEMAQSRDACAFVYSMVAVTLILTLSPSDVVRPSRAAVSYWADQVILQKQAPGSGNDVSPRTVMTSDFLHIALMGLHKVDLAFYYLREAITLATILRIDDPVAMAQLSLSERSKRQRLLWELFIHERYYTIACYRVSVVRAPASLPERDPDIPYHMHEGWMQLIRLFRTIDDDFMSNWLNSRPGANLGGVTMDWIKHKHLQIDEETAGSDEMVAPLSVMQQADLILTKHWLRTLVWQLALSNCLLGSSNSPMSLTFPLGLSSSLRNLITRMSRRDIAVHGSGIQEKFFEITDTIASVLLTQPIVDMPRSMRHAEDFVFLAKFVFTLPTFGDMQRQILNDKLSALQRYFPAQIGQDQLSPTNELYGFSEWLDQTSLDHMSIENMSVDDMSVR